MKASEIKLPFGLNGDGILVHISNVERGKQCLCVCPSCKSELIAAKGTKIQFHFKHATGSECETGLESAIHLAAKQIIKEKKQIALPEWVVRVSAIDSAGVEHFKEEVIARNGMVVNFDSVEEEKILNGMRPDILAIKGNKPLIIEICYRHKVENQKLAKIIEANISAVEINLSDLTSEDVKDWGTFWECINDPKRVQWLHSASIHSKLKRDLATKIEMIEKQYQQERLRQQRIAERQQADLSKALLEFDALTSKETLEKLNLKAETHPIWRYHSQSLPFSWGDLPDFLNAEVLHGDWLFGCDRRIWQIAFYNNFIIKNSSPFTTKVVHEWLKNTAQLKTPRCAAIIGKYSKLYPDITPAHVLNNLPSPWRTLAEYFNYLRWRGKLGYSGYDSKYKESSWYPIKSKMPDVCKR